jgi:hypothetical protein
VQRRPAKSEDDAGGCGGKQGEHNASDSLSHHGRWSRRGMAAGLRCGPGGRSQATVGDDTFPVTSPGGSMAGQLVALRHATVAEAAEAFLARTMPGTTRRSYAQTRRG